MTLSLLVFPRVGFCGSLWVSVGFPVGFCDLSCGFPVGFVWVSVGFSVCIPIWDGNRNDFKPMGIPTEILWEWVLKFDSQGNPARNYLPTVDMGFLGVYISNSFYYGSNFLSPVLNS